MLNYFRDVFVRVSIIMLCLIDLLSRYGPLYQLVDMAVAIVHCIDELTARIVPVQLHDCKCPHREIALRRKSA